MNSIWEVVPMVMLFVAKTIEALQMQRLTGIFSGLKNSCCTCMQTGQLTWNYNCSSWWILRELYWSADTERNIR